MRLLLVLALLLPAWGFSQNPYEKHCASCHGADRLGGMGPALLPERRQWQIQPKASLLLGPGPGQRASKPRDGEACRRRPVEEA